MVLCLLAMVILACKKEAGFPSFPCGIPMDDGKPDLYFQLIQNNAKQLDLPLLGEEGDSLSIRIWYRFPFDTTNQVLVLNFNDGSWKGRRYEYKFQQAMDTTHNETIELVVVDDVVPEDGWSSYVSTLMDHHILTLPDMRSIPGLDDGWLDGGNYAVEVTSRECYRFYNYHVPHHFTEFSEARHMVDILDLNRENFGIVWRSEERHQSRH